jgi:uncharacterized membrane protein YfcA
MFNILFDVVVICIIGIISGLLMGMTGILPLGYFLLALQYLDVGDYKTIVGTVLYVILFPLSIGSVWEFYKAKKINLFVGNVLLITMIIGSYLGSKIVLDARYKLSEKTIKYLTSVLSFIAGFLFFISAHNM